MRRTSKYIRKALSLFQSLNIKQGIDEVSNFVEEKLESIPKESPDDENFNST